MKIHPFANLFPMQSDEEIQTLADDIAKHGLRQPIVIDKDEQILDGRNRAAACLIAGVKPILEPFVGTEAELLAYVVSVNVHRRHLTTKERSEIAAKIATMNIGENQHSKKKEGGSNDPPSKPVSTKQAAKLMNVSPASVKRAKAKAKPAKSKPVKAKPDPKPAESKVDEIIRLCEDKVARSDQVMRGIHKAFAIIESRHDRLAELVRMALTLLTDDEITDVLLICKGEREQFTVPIKNRPAGTDRLL